MRVLSFFMKIFWFILNFFTPSFHKEHLRQTSRTRTRKLPLHTFVVSVLSSSRQVYRKGQRYDGLSGLLFRKSTRIVAAIDPYARDIQNCCLSILTFVDDRILAVECTIEKNFPPSAYAFDRFDDLVRATETFPDKAEQIFKRFHLLVHKVPFLSRTSSYLASWIESWLRRSGWDISAPEKDIQVDSSSTYNGDRTVSERHCKEQNDEAGKDRCPKVKLWRFGTKTSDNCGVISPKGTFKEVLLERSNNCINISPTFKEVLLHNCNKEDHDHQGKTMI